MQRALKLLFTAGVILSLIGLYRIGYAHTKSEFAQYLLESNWKESQQNSNSDSLFEDAQVHKPWPWADTWPILKLDIPKLNLSKLVLKDTSGESLAFGPGLMTPSVRPGDRGNSFIAAHRDTDFKELAKLVSGDRFLIEYRSGKALTFVVDQVLVVDSRFSLPSINSHQIRTTLVTCYPFDATEPNTPYRYLVSGTLTNEALAEGHLAQLE
jgi:sortase A